MTFLPHLFRTAGASTAAVCGDRYERAYNKALKVSFDELSEFERAFPATPRWNYRNELVPTQIVQKPLNIPDERWFEGTWIVAARGRGKTNLLRHLASAFRQDACFIFMDAKGEFIDGLSPLEAYRDRLVLFEPIPQYPLAINPLDIGGHSVELLEYMSSQLLEFGSWGLPSSLSRISVIG